MPLFQNSVVTKQFQNQDKIKLVAQWNVFKNHFQNPAIQDNIRSSKEEQYQGEFLIDLFVNVLGYTKNPTPNFNLTTEYKNVKDSKKADGAIIINDKVKAVIELKGTNTTDLNKIEVQAFGYKNNQPDCVYVITSNFEKLRFYIDNATENIEFNLFTLTEKEFELLYLCLASENITNDLPRKLKEHSLSQEKDITKKLYSDYSLFKRELHQDLVIQNPSFDALTLFKKSQKLLDRFLFLFFAEDRQLLPPNSVRLILNDWRDLQERDEQIPLYNRFKKYFEYLNTGFKGKRYDVFAYNGGLFKPDSILDSIKIDDELLFKHTFKLSEYNFQSEVDVNILGHIFENSLNELDEIKAQLEGGIINKQSTKRKKDGVFYTPKYITKYIVDNTVGKLCTDKKAEINIIEEDYFTDKKRTKTTKIPLLEKLTTYRNWLLEITICDPACGSGAFLNQALDFLIAEHKYIDELQAKLFGDALVLSDVEKTILENNLYGVDLNEESVEIAKLSLWLRTAQPNRKLNDLNNNIKCGNSLIDDVAIAGDKAFHWQNEFPQIFEKGGFDVIIGNPPYVLCQPSNTDEKTLELYKSFEVASYKIDLFHLFFEASIKHLKVKGKLGFITPNTYLTNKYIQKMRNYILNNTNIETIVNYEDAVFFDASVDVATIVLNKEKTLNETIEIFNSKLGILEKLDTKKQKDWLNESENIFNIKRELKINFDNCVKFEEIGNSYFGIQAYDRKTSISDLKVNDKFLPMIDGAEINRYELSNPNKYFNFIPTNIKSGGDYGVYSKLRIVVRQIGQTPIIGICEPNIVTSNTLYNLYLTDKNYSLKYVLAIFNSRLIKKYWLSNYSDSKQLFPKIKGYQLKQLPIKISVKENQTPFIQKADLMLSLNQDLQEQSQKFQRTILRKFELTDLPKKLQDWYLLTYPDFIKELAKKKVKFSLSQENEWEDFFLAEAKKVLEIKNKIDATDKAIDEMVYELYGLSEEEIKIVDSK
ncbi:Eco57I restriction-modification methylase domain-containing protein [Flavobacterium sp.]|uniref:Eco57I restriction-modification methylase domain-containing protein n=1 Tax=Flavobacterium sp. TaxID=239 RepID=UPI00286CE127|nr:TaqI-like C-terminal specificity domain-containing protein [Flavobacterium sp.]